MSQNKAASPDRSEEIAVVKRAQEGDAEAFRVLFDRYHKKAYRVAYRLLFDAEDAQDVAQEAFLRSFKALPRFHAEKNFFTWLYQITVHLAVDRLRKRKRQKNQVHREMEYLPEDGVSPDDALLANEQVREVREVLKKLPQKYRTVLILRELEGRSSKDIAQILHTPHATVRWRLHQARRLFQEAWSLADRKARHREVD